MNLPNIWGQGSLFAYSGLDGETTFEKSLVGYLCGDHVGIHFVTKNQCTVYFTFAGITDVKFDIVASDIVKAVMTDKNSDIHPFEMIFKSQNAVLFRYTDTAAPHIQFEAPVEQGGADDCVVYRSGEETFAFLKRDMGGCSIAVFAYGEHAEADAKAAFTEDINSEISKKLAFFEGLPVTKTLSGNSEKLFYKCFSVLKSMVYSPEGMFQTRWTTPDRFPHKKLWLWDSVFHSMGNQYIDIELAKESILAVFDTQNPDGMIPHMTSPVKKSAITQPPVLAWGILELYNRTGDKEFLEKTYEPLKKYLQWNMDNRDANHNFLYEWYVEDNSVTCRCGECGMDNSPRFDNVTAMDCIDFSCFMAKEAASLSKISEILNKSGEYLYWNVMYDRIKKAVNTYLYDEEDGFYYDRVLKDGKFKKVKSVASFLPLFAGICDTKQAQSLLNYLCDENEFGTPVGVPSIAVCDETFGSDMWRGPVWINYNYMIAQGLRDYGYKKKAAQLIEDTMAAMTDWYVNDGVVYEYYDSMNKVSPSRLNRKGPGIVPYQPGIKMQDIRDYGWSCALYVAMAMDRERKNQ